MTTPMDYAEINARLQEVSRLLNEQRVVRPGVLQSRLPVVGPLVARLRRMWNNLGSRWYVDPLVGEVNRFNETVTLSLDSIAEILVLLSSQAEQSRGGIAELETRQRGLMEQVPQRIANLEMRQEGLMEQIQQRIADLEMRQEGLMEQIQQRIADLEKLTEELRGMGPTWGRQWGPPATEAPSGSLAAARISLDEEAFWNDQAYAGLLRAKEEILTRHPGEDEEVYLRRFETDGAEHAAWLAPYYNAESKVLEIGCGIGRILKYIQAKERWGLDISQGMLEWAAIYLAEQEGIHLVKTNGFDFAGVPSDYFDLVYSLLVLQHINKRAGFNYMQETCRVLQPGGRFYLQLMTLLSEDGFRQFRAAVPVDYRYCPLYFYTPEEIRYLLAQIGLAVDDLSASGDSIYLVGHKPLT
jgi:SAM-dependent methyltransferase